jgi:anaphase-promoting complex subunit 10
MATAAAESQLREIGSSAVWTVTSSKPGCGVELLRDGMTDTYWQSDGVNPHYITVQFPRRVQILEVRMFIDIKQDESYTPNKIAVKAGTGLHDLQVRPAQAASPPLFPLPHQLQLSLRHRLQPLPLAVLLTRLAPWQPHNRPLGTRATQEVRVLDLVEPAGWQVVDMRARDTGEHARSPWAAGAAVGRCGPQLGAAPRRASGAGRAPPVAPAQGPGASPRPPRPSHRPPAAPPNPGVTCHPAGAPLSAFCLELGILSNHQNGRDTHIRLIHIYGPRQDPLKKLLGLPLEMRSPEFQAYSTIR